MAQAPGFQLIDIEGDDEPIEVPIDATDDEIRHIIQKVTGESKPADFGRDFVRGAWGQGKGILTGIRDVAGAAKDVFNHSLSPDPEMLPALLKGFGTGAVEGVKHAATNPLEFQENFTGVHAAGDQSIGEKAGATAVNMGAMLLPFLPRGVRRAGRAGSAPAVEAGRLTGTKAHVPATLEEALVDILNEAKGLGPEVVKPKSRFIPPAQENTQPVTLARGVPENMGRAGGRTSAPRPRKVAEEPVGKAVEPPAAAVEQPSAVAEEPLTPSGSLDPRTSSTSSGEPMTLDELRSQFGAREATNDPRLAEIGKELGVDITPDMVRDMTGHESNWPGKKVEADLDGDFARLIADERGSVATDLFKTIGHGANQLRVASMLSGLALPKSLLGNAGAIATAAAESGSMRPFRELFNVGKNVRNAKDAWDSGANPAGIHGAGRINIPGRAMGAFDSATQKLLERAGLSTDEAKRLLLTRDNKAGKNLGIDNPVGRVIWPFQRTPFNAVKEGFSGENWRKNGKIDGKRTALTVGATGAGELLGENTDDPRLLGLAAALAGPRGIPLLLGAGFGGAGRNAVAGISPLPEWGIPTDANDLIRLTGIEPAAVRAFGPKKSEGGRTNRADRERRTRQGGR